MSKAYVRQESALPGSIKAISIPEPETFFDNLMTMQDLLEMLRHQYSRYTIYRWVQANGMPHKRIRGKLWFPKSEVIQWLERSSS